jgi:FkbM family methyltransferase
MSIGEKILNVPSKLLRKWRVLLNRPTDFEEQAYAALVRKGDLVFDVGANIGGVSRFLSVLVGKEGAVIAFEPVWPSYQRLCESLNHRPRNGGIIIPLPFGLSESEGSKLIHVENENFGRASFAPNQTANVVSYWCDFTTITALTERKKLPSPSFVKVDVEGAELYVLRGANALLSSTKSPIFLIEIFAPWQKAFGYHPWDVLSLLAQHGYAVLFMCHEGLVEHTPSAERPFPPQYRYGYNVIAYKPSIHEDRISQLRPLFLGGTGKVLDVGKVPEPNVP